MQMMDTSESPQVEEIFTQLVTTVLCDPNSKCIQMILHVLFCVCCIIYNDLSDDVAVWDKLRTRLWNGVVHDPPVAWMLIKITSDYLPLHTFGAAASLLLWNVLNILEDWSLPGVDGMQLVGKRFLQWEAVKAPVLA